MGEIIIHIPSSVCSTSHCELKITNKTLPHGSKLPQGSNKERKLDSLMRLCQNYSFNYG
jgi:hypothetical protein